MVSLKCIFTGPPIITDNKFVKIRRFDKAGSATYQLYCQLCFTVIVAIKRRSNLHNKAAQQFQYISTKFTQSPNILFSQPFL